VDAKTLDFARGCNSIQNQLVNRFESSRPDQLNQALTAASTGGRISFVANSWTFFSTKAT
jgi:hypothetical protein